MFYPTVIASNKSMPQTNINEIQENLSFSYLHVVVSRAGGVCTATSRGEDNRGWMLV
jgi:hypothetical protein